MDSKSILPKKISRKNVYSSNWLNLNLDKVLFPSGRIVDEYNVLEFKYDSVVVLMANENNDYNLF